MSAPPSCLPPEPEALFWPDAAHPGGVWHVHHWGCSPETSASARQTPVVALHGFTGSGRDFEALIAQQSANRCWLAPDLPGHGNTQSLPLAAHAIPAMAKTLAGEIKKLPSKPVLLGYSMGGRLALHYAETHPETLAGLALISSGEGIREPEARRLRAEHDSALADRIEAKGIDWFAPWWENQPVIRSQAAIPAPWGERLRDRRRSQTAEGLANSLRAAGQGVAPSLGPNRHWSNLPLWHISGADDAPYRDAGRLLTRRFAQGDSTVMQNVGHTAHLEDPEGFFAHFGHFLQSIDIILQ